MSDEIQVSISQASVKQIIEAKVQAAVMDALSPHASRFVQEIVDRVLTQKSNDEKYRYGREENKPTILGHMVNEMIEQETRKALQAWAEENREQLAKKLRESLRRNSTWSNKLAQQLVESLVSASAYEFQVSVKPKDAK
jgi:hypothetical protein